MCPCIHFFPIHSFAFSCCPELHVIEHITPTSKGNLMALWKQNLSPQLGHQELAFSLSSSGWAASKTGFILRVGVKAAPWYRPPSNTKGNREWMVRRPANIYEILHTAARKQVPGYSSALHMTPNLPRLLKSVLGNHGYFYSFGSSREGTPTALG